MLRRNSSEFDKGTKSSYDLALERRFDNERKLVEQILKRLFSIPSSNSNFQSIKELLDTTRNCLAQLKSIPLPGILFLFIWRNRNWIYDLRFGICFVFLKLCLGLKNLLGEHFQYFDRDNQNYLHSHYCYSVAVCNKYYLPYKCFKLPTFYTPTSFRPGHFKSTCKLNTKCQICSKPHHTIVHNKFSTKAISQVNSSGRAKYWKPTH